ncbi:MAG TPA: DUF983 domain-containing protein [Novosphingobium sp.]|jgi:uncharacterized protein (DUF983 family)|nr:DUF983 domain-containing protein [Novosphingobium sp.]
MLDPVTRPDLPQTVFDAMWRGARFRCPRCGQASLFRKYLKPVDHCPSCHQDWTLHRADDFPPYVSMFLTGHLLAPVLITIGMAEGLSLWMQIGIAAVLAGALMLALLQPAKGAVIALQWWLGMHGFQPAGRDEAKAPPKGAPGSPWG